MAFDQQRNEPRVIKWLTSPRNDKVNLDFHQTLKKICLTVRTWFYQNPWGDEIQSTHLHCLSSDIVWRCFTLKGLFGTGDSSAHTSLLLNLFKKWKQERGQTKWGEYLRDFHKNQNWREAREKAWRETILFKYLTHFL